MPYSLKFDGLAITQVADFASEHPNALLALGSLVAGINAGLIDLSTRVTTAADVLAFLQNNAPRVGSPQHETWSRAIAELQARLHNARRACRFRIAIDVSAVHADPHEELMIELWFEDIPPPPSPVHATEVRAYLVQGWIL